MANSEAGKTASLPEEKQGETDEKQKEKKNDTEVPSISIEMCRFLVVCSNFQAAELGTRKTRKGDLVIVAA